MIRCLAAVLTLAFLAQPVAAKSTLSDVEAIDNAVGRLDEAFAEQDLDTIKTLVTKDHVAVLPYRAKPETMDQLASLLSDIKTKQTDVSEPTVTILGPDSAMRTLTARFEGTYAGKEVDDKVFITSIMVKKDGNWLESFYQVTKLAD
ncbi:MAG: nuclear transport factor 2 family protein [Pseudomonadota bacterium]